MYVNKQAENGLQSPSGWHGLSWTFMDDFHWWLSWMTFMDDFHGWLSWMIFMDDFHGWLSWTIIDYHRLLAGYFYKLISFLRTDKQTNGQTLVLVNSLSRLKRIYSDLFGPQSLRKIRPAYCIPAVKKADRWWSCRKYLSQDSRH